MNNRQSYLETLNAGRPRRSNSSLDELNRTLERLEGQLSSNRQARVDETAGGATQPGRPDRDASAHRKEAGGDGDRSAFLEELKSFRSEMREQMTTALRREFEALRGEFMQSVAHGDAAATDRELAGELERLSDAIQALAERGDDGNLQTLRTEIAELRETVERFAPAAASGGDAEKWEAIEYRLADLSAQVQASRNSDAQIDAIARRLAQIGDAMENLPEAGSVQSLEGHVRTLAQAIGHFSRQSDAHPPAAIAAVEERLDEISRAIVASSIGGGTQAFDEAIARVENRIASLSAQLNELANERPAAEVLDRLAELSARVDEIGARASFPDAIVERLTVQLAAIAERLDSAGNGAEAELILDAIEQRFGSMAELFEQKQGDGLEQAHRLFHELGSRIDDVVERIEAIGHPSAQEGGSVMGLIDSRLAAFEERLERTDETALRGIEARLATITQMLGQPGSDNVIADAEAVQRLEAQVKSIAERLSLPREGVGDLAEVGPRLDTIERRMTEDRDAILVAAREASEAVNRALQVQSDMPHLAELAEDLRSIEALTRRSDERNGKTFEAIHDTLLKIVERLATMEEGRTFAATEPPRHDRRTEMAVDETPSLEPEIDEVPDLEESSGEAVRLNSRSPAIAAAEAAIAAVEEGPRGEKADMAGEKRSLFGSVRRAMSGRKEKKAERVEPSAVAEAPAAEAASAPSTDLDAPLDPKIANRPLAPGSGAPDLNAIMKRVRDERGLDATGNDADAARSDFIAAARRAAQAAAAETEVMKRGSDKSTARGGFSFGGLLKSKRKAALMATTALLVALAGMQLGKAFLGEAGKAEVAAEAKPASATVMSAVLEAPAEPVAEDATAAIERSPAASLQDRTSAQEAATAPSPDDETKAPQSQPSQAARPAEEVSPDQADASATAEPDAARMAGAGDGGTAPEPGTVATATAPAGGQDAAAPQPPADTGPVALRQAADGGDAAALFEVANRHAEGKGVTADMAEAAKWFERAAELGLAPAQFRIGNLYEKGVGVGRDLDKAKTWYQLAAAQGNASAMHNLAVLYAMGADGTTDNESAVRWFRGAAEHGVKDSQFNLGILAAKGVGMTQDLAESYKWFALVAKTGDKDAAEKRDEIAKVLTPEQLDKAKATTELWRPKALDPEANSVTIPDEWTESEDRTASVDMTKAVKTVQIILNKNGYEAGGVDGMMGAQTRSAIAAFQKDNGMTATGEVDEGLVKALLERR